MKKFLSIILALAMAACMSVTAFAEDGLGGTTKLTTTVPDKRLYTLHVPADQAITYGSPETNIGKAYVSDADLSLLAVTIGCSWTNLSDGYNSIPLKIVLDSYFKQQGGGYSRVYDHDDPGRRPYIYTFDAEDRYCEYFAQVTQADWEAAVPGNYSATITWTTVYDVK